VTIEIRIEGLLELPLRGVESVLPDVGAGEELRTTAHVLGELLGLLLEARAIGLPELDDARQQRLEARAAVTVVGRKIRSGEERLLILRQEHRHRPAAVARHRDGGGHVDVVEIRPLFAVDLDAHELRVQEPRGLFVFERFSLHDVAPVARRVADAEEDGFFLALRARERFCAPRVPVHRVLRMRKQIRAGLVGETIRAPGRGRHVTRRSLVTPEIA